MAIINEPDPIDKIQYAATAEITGGTVIAITNEPQFPSGSPRQDPFKAIEALGDGFVMVVGDSNIFNHGEGLIWCQDNPNNCEFFKRWCFNKNEDIL